MQTRQQIDHILQCLCDMYNHCDINCAEQYFAPNICYDSMWVLSTMTGKSVITFYLDTKFKAMKAGGMQPKATIMPEQPAILIRQGETLVALVVDIKGGFITQLSLVEPALLIDKSQSYYEF